MSFRLGLRSRLNLRGVHHDLVRVVERAIDITEIDFTVIEGLRTRERQAQLLAQGATRTLNSRHITGHAVDIAPYIGGRVRWDWPTFDRLLPFVREAAEIEGVAVIFGADWKSFRDGPHLELDRKVYL